ncbi:hypothetical protein CEXT_58741 [Caerostris extrusa]|uniref:Uncharacterized protein n=1 Tax=Caerostris extrusa TaxID=172846 RepID=A0AAV4XMG7_CAEEX|nr:hypothetical protein CEXT_58741 [Caerostris extrusa]
MNISHFEIAKAQTQVTEMVPGAKSPRRCRRTIKAIAAICCVVFEYPETNQSKSIKYFHESHTIAINPGRQHFGTINLIGELTMI